MTEVKQCMDSIIYYMQSSISSCLSFSCFLSCCPLFHFLAFPLSCPFLDPLKVCHSWGMEYIFTWHDKLKDLLKQEQMSSLFARGRSIKLLAIHVSLSATLVLRVGDINHVAQDLYGHCGSLQTAAWDTNKPSSW